MVIIRPVSYLLHTLKVNIVQKTDKYLCEMFLTRIKIIKKEISSYSFIRSFLKSWTGKYITKERVDMFLSIYGSSIRLVGFRVNL